MRAREAVEVGLPQHADAGARRGARAFERHDRRAHPQCVKRGGGAIIGKGVERQIDTVMPFEIGAMPLARPELF